MALLPILKYGEPLLCRPCEPVKEITPEIRQLVRDMLETMYAEPGAGLAANQVGVSLRICVIDVRPEGEPEPLVLINPKIVHKEGKYDDEEGCLSIPGVSVVIKRYHRVRVEATSERGFPVSLTGEGVLAKALQHEIDHLDGILCVDHLSPAKRKDAEQAIARARKRWKERR